MNIVLASTSERRIELLSRLTADFKTIDSKFDETKVKFNNNPSQYVMEIASGKAESASKILKSDAVIIGCDTVVYFNGRIFGKPADKNEAFHMLNELSGNIHKVYSGISIINTVSGETQTDYVCTDVKFSTIPEQKIIKYMSTGEPMGKAGAYAIQGYAAVFVEEIHGCYYNIVGLPLNKLNSMLMKMGVNL